MLKYIRYVIYDFDIEGYDDRFLDYRNMCHRIMEKLSSLSIESKNIKNHIEYITAITKLQKKEQLLSFIDWYRSGFVEFTNNNIGIDFIRQPAYADDSKPYLYLVDDIEKAICIGLPLDATIEKITSLYQKIYDDLGPDFGNRAVNKLLNKLQMESRGGFNEKYTQEQMLAYKNMYDTIKSHFGFTHE